MCNGLFVAKGVYCDDLTSNGQSWMLLLGQKNVGFMKDVVLEFSKPGEFTLDTFARTLPHAEYFSLLKIH